MATEERYELCEELGRGAFGVVKRCIQLSNKREFAAKIIDTTRIPRSALEKVEREANICRLLKHPNIVQLHDSFHVNGSYFMIFDLIIGGELFEDIVAREYYSESSASACIYFVLDALAYCHRKRIIHRDLKPENLLLANRSKDAPIKIADFGLALQTTDNQPRKYGLAGTYAYMAPEVIQRDAYNNSVDVWSCGVILYLLLAGYPPFWDQDDDRLQRKILQNRHTYPTREWSLITRSAKDLIDQMLERNPSKRISAAGALQHPWLRERAKTAANIHLSETVIHLKRFNARRKFKAAVMTTMLANRQAKFAKRNNEVPQDFPPLPSTVRTNSFVEYANRLVPTQSTTTAPYPKTNDYMPRPVGAHQALPSVVHPTHSPQYIPIADRPKERRLSSIRFDESRKPSTIHHTAPNNPSPVTIVRIQSPPASEQLDYTIRRVRYPLVPAQRYDSYRLADSRDIYYIQEIDPSYQYYHIPRGAGARLVLPPERTRIVYL